MHLNQRMLWIDDFSYVICHLFVFIAIFVGVENWEKAYKIHFRLP